jgi:hypothetical protein
MNLIKYIKNIPKEVHVFDLLLKKTVQKKFDFWISHELDKVHKIWIPNEVHVLRFASANGWSKNKTKRFCKWLVKNFFDFWSPHELDKARFLDRTSINDFKIWILGFFVKNLIFKTQTQLLSNGTNFRKIKRIKKVTRVTRLETGTLLIHNVTNFAMLTQ